MIKRIYFACFADGPDSIKNSGNRILEQARRSNIFDDCRVFNRQSMSELTAINMTVNDIMNIRNHGFGFFIWKPILISALLEKTIPEDSILVYCDSGTELVTNKYAEQRMHRVISRLGEQPILAFQTDFPEYFHTKSICLSLIINPEDKRTKQIEATTILIRNCPEARVLIAEWKRLAQKDNFKYLNDDLSHEAMEFIEHRHDQSIFSVLYKNAGYKPLRMSQVLGYLHKNSNLSPFRRFRYNSFFLWQIRNRSGNTVVKKYQHNNILSLILLPLQYFNQPTEYLLRIQRIVKGKIRYLKSESKKN